MLKVPLSPRLLPFKGIRKNAFRNRSFECVPVPLPAWPVKNKFRRFASAFLAKVVCLRTRRLDRCYVPQPRRRFARAVFYLPASTPARPTHPPSTAAPSGSIILAPGWSHYKHRQFTASSLNAAVPNASCNKCPRMKTRPNENGSRAD